MAEVDCLMSYGPDISDLYLRVATYLDRILKDAKPADVPVEQPTKFSWPSTSRPPRPSGSRSRRRFWGGQIGDQ